MKWLLSLFAPQLRVSAPAFCGLSRRGPGAWLTHFESGCKLRALQTLRVGELPAGYLAAIVLAGLCTLGKAEEGTLHVMIRDGITGAPVSCTVTIIDSQGKSIVENTSFKGGFRCAGEFVKRLPTGRTRIRITRGLETKAVEREVELQPDRTNEVQCTLERLVDLRGRGWYAGDSHVHMLHGERTVPVDFDFVALSARAEDLQYLCLAQDWIIKPATPEALEAALGPRSTRDCQLTWNLEAPKNYYKGDAGRCLGHCWNIGMRGRTLERRNVIEELMEASAWDYESDKATYANFESHKLIHRQGGAVFYTHPARWWLGSWGGQGGYPRLEHMRVSNMAVELPLDVLLGPTFDGLDVLTGPGEHEANAKAFELWALLLNHGYHLAATASSDACFDRSGGGIPGAARTYTFLPEGFSFPAVARATAAGKTFATTGPLLVVDLDHAPPGTSLIPGPKQHLLSIEAWSSGDDSAGLSRVELIRNGTVFKQFPFKEGLFFFHTNLPVLEAGPAWYSVRAFEGMANNRIAVTGAFYFARPASHPPKPVSAQVHVQILDAISGEPLAATLTEVTFEGRIGRDGKRHSIPRGQNLVTVPGIVRLRAESKGYAPQTLSPVLDDPNLIKTVTGFSDTDLLDWHTFDRLREQLEDVRLVFRLERK